MRTDKIQTAWIRSCLLVPGLMYAIQLLHGPKALEWENLDLPPSAEC